LLGLIKPYHVASNYLSLANVATIACYSFECESIPMTNGFNSRYPTVADLRRHAITKIPRFAFEYLDGGCNENINIEKNSHDLQQVELKPHYLAGNNTTQLETQLFGQRYSAPFGISPIGLQGLVWPKAPEILAKAAANNNIPFILSTVSTASIETISEITAGKLWFQLYHPVDESLRNDILRRCETAGVKVLVLLCDVPTFGYRPADIRNGLAMPPKMSLANIAQITSRPEWALKTLLNGTPSFETLKPYMSHNMDMRQLAGFMDSTFDGRLDTQKITAIRDKWKDKIVLKGVVSESDVAQAIRLGIDGVIVSNHGGRQLDAGQSSIAALHPIVKKYADQITIMMDSGIRSGPDIARSLASGAEFTFLGRAFMYSVAALGAKGGEHAVALLTMQLRQVMEQLRCAAPTELKHHLID
jgi:L-lactate dehydrogenase (cytochrome)